MWNEIAFGDRERAAVLVVFNAIFQVCLLAAGLLLPDRAAWLARPRHPGLRRRHLGSRAHRPDLPRHPAHSRASSHGGSGFRRRGRDWYKHSSPGSAPITLYGLLFTIVLLFAIQGDEITSEPLDVALIAAAAARLLRRDVGRWASHRASCSGSRTPRPRALGVHRRLERLRACDRRRRRSLRRHLGSGARRRRRPSDRGAGSRRARIRGAVAPRAPGVARAAGTPAGNRAAAGSDDRGRRRIAVLSRRRRTSPTRRS